MGHKKCSVCKGSGLFEIEKVIAVSIGAGIRDGMRVRVPGQGDNSRYGKSKGNLYVHVRVEPHDVFEREGNDVHVEVRIPFEVACLGGEITVPTLSGDAEVEVHPGTNSGDIMVMDKFGIPDVSKPEEIGDQLIHFVVDIPRDLNALQIDLLTKLKNVAPNLDAHTMSKQDRDVSI